MHYALFDFVDHRGNNAIKLWMHGLEKAQRAKLNQKLDMLMRNGPGLSTGLLSDTRLPHIKKIRIKGQVAIRLMLCRGPVNMQTEFSLLLGAKERDRKLIPKDAETKAEHRRQEILSNSSIKRCCHERVE